MLSRFRKETPPLELYGKLPIAKDYLRIGGGRGAGIALRDWVDQSFSTRVERGESAMLAWPGRFLVAHYSGEPLLGCSWPSSDTGGHRRFPFLAFIERRRRALANEWSAGGSALRPLWDHLVGAYTSHQSYGDGQTFLSAMRGQEIVVGDGPTPEVERVDFELWHGGLWPDAGVDPLVEVLASLTELGRGRTEGPIRLPLLAGLPLVPQVHAWWTALADLRLVESGAVPSVFFPLPDADANVPQFATFLLGALHPEHQAWLAPPTSPLGPGDFAFPEPRRIDGAGPASEATPPLAESMRGPLISARARSA